MRLFPNRLDDKSEGKAKWGFLRWFDITLQGEVYLTRLTLLRTPWFSIKLHWIHKADPDRDLHDHPWTFRSFVLRGWYKERVCAKPDIRGRWLEAEQPIDEVNWRFPVFEKMVRWFNYKDTRTAHRITEVSPNLLTLVITGTKNKSWGFYDPDTFKFTHWKNYHAAQS